MIGHLNILPAVKELKRTTSRCPACLRAIPAAVFERDGRVWMRKTCPAHGATEVMLAADARFYHLSLGAESGGCGPSCACHGPTNGAATSTQSASTDPFDVLSTCLALIEIVDSCNLKCPTCYAGSPWGVGKDVDCISFDEFEQRVRGVLDRKESIDILQFTGGEPTIHPEFSRLLEWALLEKRIGYVLINTNGVRIAVDDDFRARLGELRRTHGKFELYLQFDGPQEPGQMELRGADLREIRGRTIDEGGAAGIPTTLAMVVTPTTRQFLGDTLRFAIGRRHCRGITFQPMFSSGRVPRIESSLPVASLPAQAPVPISVGDVIHNLVAQSEGLLTIDDFTPLPCGDPNCHTIGYLLRAGSPAQKPMSLSRIIHLPAVQGFLKNRVDYRLDDLARCGCETEPLGAILKQLEIGPDAPFRMFIKPFMDAWTFDQDRIDRCCTHVIRPDGKLDSFCRYYLSGGAEGLGLKQPRHSAAIPVGA